MAGDGSKDLELVTQAEAARILGISREAVRKAVLRGRLKSYGPRKMVDASTLLTQMTSSSTRPEQTYRVMLDDDPPDEAPESAGKSIARLKAITEEERGRILRIEREKREGELVARAQVRAEQETVAVIIGQMLDAIPSRADEVVAAFKAGGVAGVRGALKALTLDVRRKAADALNEEADVIEDERGADDSESDDDTGDD